MRDILRKHPAIGLGVVVLCLGAAGAVTLLGGRDRTAPPGEAAYYLDTNTDTLFIAVGPASPVPAPSGDGDDGQPDGYLAYVFTCGDPFDARGLTLDELAARGGGVAYISRYTDEALAAQTEIRERRFADDDPDWYRLTSAVREGHLVRGVGPDAPWHQADTAEAYALERAMLAVCAGSRPTRLEPPRRRR